MLWYIPITLELLHKNHTKEFFMSTPRIAMVLGSQRDGSYTAQATTIVVRVLQECYGASVTVLDPNELPICFPNSPGSEALNKALMEVIRPADGVFLCSPEYNGSYSSTLKAMIDHMDYPDALEGKPIGLIGVAAGRIGAIKTLEHLRGICGHLGAMVLAYPVSVAEVHQVFDKEGNCTDADLNEQLEALAHRMMAHLGVEQKS